VRLWLRLLGCTALIEGEVRRCLHESFAVTLPRFDLMAQLACAPEGLTLTELSRRLVASGHVQRAPCKPDRRTVHVRLSEAGHAAFAEMAREHAAWIAELFADLPAENRAALMHLLGRLRDSVRNTTTAEAPP
jgi:DNA-binding MarR family transcriptional regulator